MAETDRYIDILNRCLADEDKAKRNAVLAEYSPEIQTIVRAVMADMAKRMVTWIRYSGRGRNPPLSKDQCRALRNAKLAQIQPAWLKRRVESMVREQMGPGRHETQQ